MFIESLNKKTKKGLKFFNDQTLEMYGTDNVAHCFSNSLSLNDWMKDDEFFNLMDMDWEAFLE